MYREGRARLGEFAGFLGEAADAGEGRTTMHDRTTLFTAFVDLEDRLFGQRARGDSAGAQSDAFVSGALGRRRRVRTKTDRYPTVPLGPELARRYGVRVLPTLKQLQGR